MKNQFEIEYGSSIDDFLESVYVAGMDMANWDISFRTYYRRRREAIDALSSILWGYTSKDSIAILEQFFSENGVKHDVLCRYCRHKNKRETAENLLKKLHSISEEDCRKLICDIQRNYHLPWKARTIGEMLAVARQKSGAAKLEDIMALERFDPDVRHMIEFEVLSADSTVGAVHSDRLCPLQP